MFTFFAISSVVCSSLYLYFFHPKYCQDLLLNVLWNVSIVKSKCEEIYQVIHKRYFPKLQECPQFIIYDTDLCDIENIKLETQHALDGILESLKDMLTKKENENKIVLFKTYINESPYFIRINNSTNVDDLTHVTLIKSPFLNVDLKYISDNHEKKLNITNELKPYYVKGNILFDQIFIYYFLNITYEINNINNYTLEFIDNNCASLKFTHNDEITKEHVL